MPPLDCFLKNKLILSSVFVLLSLLFHSCEYDSNDDNFHDLERPVENVEIGIDLAGVNPEETIYLYQNAYFYYSLYTGGKKVLVQKFYLDGKELNLNPENGYVYFNPEIADNQIHDLKLIMGLPTGSGSLAEYAGYEMYVGEFNFKVKFVSGPTLNMNIRKTVDENNYLKILWDKPAEYDIESYKIYNGEKETGTLIATIDNPDQTYYVDKDYVYGYKFYTIVAKLKNSKDVILTDRFVVPYSNITQDNFETQRVSTTEIKIKLTNPNPFPCKYVLQYGYQDKVLVVENTTEFVIPASTFPSWNYSFTLYILPLTANEAQYKEYSYVYGYFKDKNLNSAIIVGPDLANKLLLSLNFDYLVRYDISKLEELGSAKHNLNLHTGCVVKSSNKGRIAIDDINGFVHIYSNNTLVNQLAVINSYGYSFYLTDTDRLLVENRKGFSLYDINTGSLVSSKEWSNSENPNDEIVVNARISADGKYILAICSTYIVYTRWAELYELSSDNTLRLIKKINSGTVNNAWFNPVKATESVIQFSDNKFNVMDVVTGNITTCGGTFQNIDPFTGNLLYKGAEYGSGQYNVYVLSKDYKTVLFKIELSNVNPYSDVRLYNNFLFFNGYYMNLSKLTNQ